MAGAGGRRRVSRRGGLGDGVRAGSRAAHAPAQRRREEPETARDETNGEARRQEPKRRDKERKKDGEPEERRGTGAGDGARDEPGHLEIGGNVSGV